MTINVTIQNNNLKLKKYIDITAVDGGSTQRAVITQESITSDYNNNNILSIIDRNYIALFCR